MEQDEKQQRMKSREDKRGNRNRYLGIRRFMRVYGLTEEEAAARYDRPKGICEVCGGKAYGPLAILCEPHAAERNRAQALARWHKKQAAKPRKPKATYKKQTNIVISPGPPAPVAETIITPEGITITRIPCGRGLRNFFGDEKGETWTAAD